MSSKFSSFLFLVSSISLCLAQRPGFAGSLPYGYPVIITTTTSTTAPVASNNVLGDRFGQDTPTTTTAAPQRLPLEANGDISLINYLNTLPLDQQPFWFLNWKIMEEDRKRPHTYDTKPNGYVDFASNGGNRQQELLPHYGSFVLN